MDPVCTPTWQAVTDTGDMAEHSKCHNIGAGICVTLMIQMKDAHQHWDEACVPELGLNMCTRGSRGCGS